MTVPGKIAVICGGTSSEREVSLSSGEAIADALEQIGWDVELLDWTEKEVVNKRAYLASFDAVFVGYHGGAGEDGRIQAVLDIAGIPYTGSGTTASAVAMDKILAKRIFEQARIPTPRWLPWEKPYPPTASEVINVCEFGLPMVVKPACEGSTVGVSIANDIDELMVGITGALSYGERLLFEEYIPGREITAAILEGYELPPVEIIPRSGFYDYEHKYSEGASEYNVPADLPEKVAREVIDTGKFAFELLGLRHYARVDFRLEGDKLYCLEVNSLPGMTKLSLVPKAAGAVGIEFPELVGKITSMALKYERPYRERIAE